MMNGGGEPPQEEKDGEKHVGRKRRSEWTGGREEDRRSEGRVR